jgi:hypothetical protein
MNTNELSASYIYFVMANQVWLLFRLVKDFSQSFWFLQLSQSILN